MISELDISQDDNGLYGARNCKGDIVIPFLYKEMYPFSCGLSMVRNQNYGYSKIPIRRPADTSASQKYQ